MGITWSVRSSLNPRERLPGVRSRGLSDDLGVYPAISWVTRRSRRPPRPDETPRTRTIVPGEKSSLKNTPSGPVHALRAPPDTALRLAHVEDRAYVMRAQRDRIHPGSRHASPARQNPPRRDSREPTSHNSSSGDMTNSTPPGAPSGGSAAGAAGTGRRPRRRRWGIPAPGGAIGRGPSLRAAARDGGPDGVGGGLAPSPGVPGRLVPSGSRSPGPAPGGAVGREPRGNRGITAERPVGGGAGAPRVAIAAPPSFQGTRPRFRNRSSCAAVV